MQVKLLEIKLEIRSRNFGDSDEGQVSQFSALLGMDEVERFFGYSGVDNSQALALLMDQLRDYAANKIMRFKEEDEAQTKNGS